jgi:hypothetical protein
MQRNGAAPVFIFFFGFCFRVSFFFLAFQGSVLAVANNYCLASANAAIHTYLADPRSASRDPICGEEGGTGQLGEEAYGAAQQECPGGYFEDSISEFHQGQKRKIYQKSECMAAIFPFSKSLIERLAKVGVHVCRGSFNLRCLLRACPKLIFNQRLK